MSRQIVPLHPLPPHTPPVRPTEPAPGMPARPAPRPAMTRLAPAALLLALAAPLAFAQGGPPPAAVKVSRAELRAIAPSVTVTGVVQSRTAADLAAPVAGRLLWVAEPGTAVKSGDVVARFVH